MVSKGIFMVRDGRLFNRNQGYFDGSFTFGVTKPTPANTGLNVQGVSMGALSAVPVTIDGNGYPTWQVTDSWLNANATTYNAGTDTYVVDRVKMDGTGWLVYTGSHRCEVTNSYLKSPTNWTSAASPGASGAPASPYNGTIHARSTSRPLTATISAINCYIRVGKPWSYNQCLTGERIQNVIRCDLAGGEDQMDLWNGAANRNILGNYFGQLVFWDDDPNRASDSQHPGWTHNDQIQISGANGLIIDGNAFPYANIDLTKGAGQTLINAGWADGKYASNFSGTPNSDRSNGIVIRNNWFGGTDQPFYLSPAAASPGPADWQVYGNRLMLPHRTFANGSYAYQLMHYRPVLGLSDAMVHDNTWDNDPLFTGAYASLPGTPIPTVSETVSGAPYQFLYLKSGSSPIPGT